MTEAPKDLIDAVLRETLGPYGFDHSDVRADFDHDGEPALFIDAIFKPKSPLVEGKIYSAALGALSNMLLRHGDRRFPYLMLHHPDDEPAEPPSTTEESAAS